MIPTIELLDPQNPTDLLSPLEHACLDNLLAQLPLPDEPTEPRHHFTLRITRKLPLDRLIRVVSTAQRIRFEMPSVSLSLCWNLNTTERQLFQIAAPALDAGDAETYAVAQQVVLMLRTHLRPLLRR